MIESSWGLEDIKSREFLEQYLEYDEGPINDSNCY